MDSSLIESRCPCRDVGEAIPAGLLRPIRTAHKTLGGRNYGRESRASPTTGFLNRVARFTVTHPAWEPYAGIPLVRICAEGVQQ